MREIEKKAKQFAYEAHKGMKRKGKDTPFIYHLKSVNLYLESLTDDEEILAAGWLHDVIEDTPVTLEELKKEFNRTVCRYVELETEDKSLPWKDRKLKQINYDNSNDRTDCTACHRIGRLGNRRTEKQKRNIRSL